MILIIDNYITGLDFDPSGTLVACLAQNGVCLISDIDTNNSSYHTRNSTTFGNLFKDYMKIKMSLLLFKSIIFDLLISAFLS